MGFGEVPSEFAKYRVRIDKVENKKGKISVKGKMIDAKIRTMDGSTIEIDIEGAIDNKEIY